MFEPRDEHKGAAARAMLYFAIRYQDYGNFIDAQEGILKNWHTTFKPTALHMTGCTQTPCQQLTAANVPMMQKKRA